MHRLARIAVPLTGAIGIGLVPLLWGDAAVLTSPLRLATNLLPWFGPWLLLLAWLRRPLAASVWVILLQSIFLGLHELKLRHLGLPLVPADAVAAEQMLFSPALYLRYLDPSWRLAGAAGLVAIALLHRLDQPAAALRGRLRWTTAIAGAAMITSLALAASPWRWFYDRERLDVHVWMPAEAAEAAGATAHFLHLYLHTSSSLPPADAAVAADAMAWLARNEHEFGVTASTTTLPDLIVVQSESFMDPGALLGMDNEQFAPQLARLRLQHAHGDLRVPAFGGLTTRTEFEFLTAFPLLEDARIQYPYQGLVHRPLQALPWTLVTLGYQTAAVHPSDLRFYRRDLVLPLLGFEQLHGISEFDPADVHGYHVSDAALNRRIIELLGDGAPQFLFAVTMENHGPWDESRAIPQDALPQLPAAVALAETSALQMRRFLHHTRRADAALGELARWVMQRQRPTLLLFYGDHLPGLAPALEQWGFDDGLTAVAQATPWLLVDNRSTGTQRIDLHAHELAPWLLARAGIADAGLFAPLEALRRARARSALPESARDWHSQLVAAALREEPTARSIALADAEMTKLVAWSPQSAEADAEVSAALTVWFQFEPAIDRSFQLEIGGERLRTLRQDGHLLVAELPAPGHRSLRSEPATVPVRLVDPVGRRQQVIGKFVVRPRAERLGGWHGFGAGPFCAIDIFGPPTLAASASAGNERVGLWLRAGCIPDGAKLVFDGTVLDTTVVDDLATAWIPPALLAKPRDVALQLRAGDAELAVGHIAIQP
ncbi:MAG: LTA synthase family protein [Xanthomonadales bacterium]|nr:LTA synthase family protein [Xanthomonadales bacterium]